MARDSAKIEYISEGQPSCYKLGLNSHSDRTGSVGLDLEGRPKIWRVYVRRNRGVKRGGEVGSGVTVLPSA